ncbi:putative uncharacterized protein DDB_G0271606 [Eupeodes corollae]|uniref:putative uncharacterized protein DDB_G0271606 n=1 Tax=Eupeodes corollae TaxID=290404 RepID=UPI0024918804|nr:putative uncharacterized protein DDB_G0271606 [Eupeodes corollae]
MVKEKKAGVSKDTSANTSFDVAVVPAAVPQATATTSGQASDQWMETTTNKKRKIKKHSPNKVERANSAKRRDMRKEMKSGKGGITTESDANVVPSAVHKFTATSSGHQSDSPLTTTNVKRKLKPNLVERNNAAKRGAMRQGVQQKKQKEMTSQSESSDGDIDYVSEGGEGHYRSPKNKNRFSSLAPPEQPKEREMEVPEAPNDNEADEAELAQVLQAKKQQIDAYEDQLKKLKEEMEPLLSALRNKIEARRQKEAAEKEDKQAQRLLQQQQQQQAKQKKPDTRQQKQQPQQQQPKPATKITGAEQKIKALPAVTGSMKEGPSTSSKAKQQQQQELQARQQQQQKQ